METQYRSCVTHQLTHYIWETQFKNIGSDFDIMFFPAKLDIFKAEKKCFSMVLPCRFTLANFVIDIHRFWWWILFINTVCY